MKLIKILGATLVAFCAFAAGPAFAGPCDQLGGISDSLTVYAPTGAIVGQAIQCESGEDASVIDYLIGIPIDPNQFGNATDLIELGTGANSDIFGIAAGCNSDQGDLCLAFASDTETQGVDFGTFPLTFLETTAGPWNATFYLDPQLQALGYTAQFFSDAENVPEPLTLSLFGAGLIGLGALRRRKAHKTA